MARSDLLLKSDRYENSIENNTSLTFFKNWDPTYRCTWYDPRFEARVCLFIETCCHECVYSAIYAQGVARHKYVVRLCMPVQSLTLVYTGVLADA